MWQRAAHLNQRHVIQMSFPQAQVTCLRSSPRRRRMRQPGALGRQRRAIQCIYVRQRGRERGAQAWQGADRVLRP